MIRQAKNHRIARLEGLPTRDEAGPDGRTHAAGCAASLHPRPERAKYRYRLGSHRLVLATCGAALEASVARAGAEFALVVEGPLLVLGFRFGEAARWTWADPYHWHFAPTALRVVPAAIALTPESYSRLWSTLWVTAVDVADGRARVRRAVALRPEFTHALHGVLRAQALRPFPAEAAARALKRLRDADAPLWSRARIRTRCTVVSAHGSRGGRPRVGRDGAAPDIPMRHTMQHDPRSPIVVADGYWRHIRHTRIHHRHFPEVRGEGASPAAAAAQLSRQLARAVDLAQGREEREAMGRALAEVHAFRPAEPGRRRVCGDAGGAGPVRP